VFGAEGANNSYHSNFDMPPSEVKNHGVLHFGGIKRNIFADGTIHGTRLHREDSGHLRLIQASKISRTIMLILA
jgi:hypothetical protein